MYKISARQILLIALLSAVFAAGLVFSFNRFGKNLQPNGFAFTEKPLAGITDPSLATDEQNNIEVYRAVSPGVAYITSTTVSRDFFGQFQEGEGSGSGSVIDDQGHILTNFHVIDGAQKLSVRFAGDKDYPAKYIGGDPDTDLAVIQVEIPREQLAIVPLGDSDKLIVGQKVLAIGNPFGLDRTLTTGVISGLQRPIRTRPLPGDPNGHQIEGAIQTDASINPGNSGGPLLDTRARVVGVNTALIAGAMSLCFAVPADTARWVVSEVLRHGHVRRAWLGIAAETVAMPRRSVLHHDLAADSAVSVNEVLKAGPAERAGVQAGDRIVRVDEHSTPDVDTLHRLLGGERVGREVRLELLRGPRKLALPLVPAARS